MLSFSKWLMAMLFVSLTCLTLSSNEQMRQMYLDTDEDNHVLRSSFFSASEGFVVFTKWIGYSADRGSTVNQKVSMA
ncbi:hypothetical protein C7475_108302 [Chitinophaga sp. S165]|nr:hypothetical protein C7475_108302 [Chitinophaga sp. S165]